MKIGIYRSYKLQAKLNQITYDTATTTKKLLKKKSTNESSKNLNWL